VKLHASYVSVHDFGGLHFQVSFDTEDPNAEDADFDPSALERPYLLIQRQFEDEDDGVCYIETHEPNTYAGHFRLHLIELTTTRLLFEIDRPTDRMVEVTFALDWRRSREVERILGIIFGAKL
jgi:hypothetical protein